MNKKLLAGVLLVLVAIGLWTMRTTSGEEWQQTRAEITSVERMDDGTYAYSLTYTPVWPDGRTEEPISQHAFGAAKAPVLGQQIEMRYLAQEPVIYELLGEMKWEAQ